MSRRPRGWLLLLTALLAVGEPALLAWSWSGQVVAVLERGPAAIVLFAARILITAFGIAAGMALWQAKPHAVAMAKIFLLLSTAATALTLATRWLPGRPQPGLAVPIFLIVAAYNAAWFVYLSIRIRTQ